MKNSIQVHGLWHRFAFTDVLCDVSLQLHQGETVALIGPSGCGKSTLMRVLLGLVTPTAGQVINTFKRAGGVFQQPCLLPWLDVIDNIALGLRARGVARGERRRRAAALASRMELALTDYTKYPHELSGGMQSRVALARAMVITPDWLVLDEPFSALDRGLRAEMYRLVREYIQHQHCACLLITHDVMEAVRLADRVLMMAAPGRIVHQQAYLQPMTARDEAWVYRYAAALMAEPAVREGFELESIL